MKRFPRVRLFALAFLLAIPASASTFLAVPRGELVRQADAVVEGRVLKVSSFWSPSGRLIFSEAVFQVEETIVGKAPSALVLRTAGGTVGSYTVEAHGFPTFEVGERFLLFVDAGSPSQVVGYQQGQFRIVRDPKGGDIAVPAIDKGVRLLTAEGRLAPRPLAVGLNDLKAQIRAEAIRAGRIVN